MKTVVVLLALAAHPVRAQPCDPVAARAQLQADATRMDHWRAGWAIGYGALTVGQVALVAAKWNPTAPYDRVFRDTMIAGAVESGLGTIAKILSPAIDLSGEPCTALAKAGKLERKNFWTAHIGSIVVNLAGGLILAHETTWSSGLVLIALGYPISLADTYTMPRGSWHLSVTPLRDGAALALAGAF